MGYVTYSFKVKRPNPGKVRHLLAFMAGPWRRGLNFCVEQAKQHRPRRAFDLHPFVYLHLRERLGLGAQLAEACRDTAYEAYASHRARRRDGGRGRVPHWAGLPALRLNIPRSLRLSTRGSQYWAEVSLAPREVIRLRITGKASALRRVGASVHPTASSSRGTASCSCTWRCACPPPCPRRAPAGRSSRSEERRVGKECRS